MLGAMPGDGAERLVRARALSPLRVGPDEEGDAAGGDDGERERAQEDADEDVPEVGAALPGRRGRWRGRDRVVAGGRAADDERVVLRPEEGGGLCRAAFAFYVAQTTRDARAGHVRVQGDEPSLPPPGLSQAIHAKNLRAFHARERTSKSEREQSPLFYARELYDRFTYKIRQHGQMRFFHGWGCTIYC